MMRPLAVFCTDDNAEPALKIAHSLAHRNELFRGQFGIRDDKLARRDRTAQIGGKGIFHAPWAGGKKGLANCRLMLGLGSDAAFELDHLGAEQKCRHRLGDRDQALVDRPAGIASIEKCRAFSRTRIPPPR